LGNLGQEQLEWLEADVKRLPASTPIVVFAHIPLWSVYPPWGWGTDDSAQALSYLKRFGSVTGLNGPIHQTMQKVEGNITFHTAASTAFPQPKPGAAPSPGPMKVEAERLRGLLGITEVNVVQGRHPLAIVDSALAASAAPQSHPGEDNKEASSRPQSRQAGETQVRIDNFTFTPASLTIPAGTSVTWVNHDDIPHTVVETNKRFSSPVLDTDGKFTYRFMKAGVFSYFCSIH